MDDWWKSKPRVSQTGRIEPTNFLSTLMQRGAPNLLAVAQSGLAGALNLLGGTGVTGDVKKDEDTKRPVSGQMTSFAAQGGAIAAAGSAAASNAGGQGDPYAYNQQPLKGKFPGGTATGGWILLPPEVSLGDAPNGFVPPNITRSETSFVAGPGALFGAGPIELATGKVKSGFSWYVDSATGDLVFFSCDAASNRSQAVRLTNTAQNIAWYAGTTFSGTVTHGNTASRQWAFPDYSSNVGLMDQVSGVPVATAPEGTFAWDYTGNNLYVNSDGAATWQFIGGASSVTGSGAANRLAYWTSATAISSDAGFTINATNDSMAIAGFLNIGTTTSAIAQGDFASGLSAAGKLFYDQSEQSFNLYGTSGALGTIISSKALVATVLNEEGLDIDTRIEGDTDPNLLFCDASTDRVGIGTSGPDAKLDVLSTSTQLRLTYTDGTVYTDFLTDSGGNIVVSNSGNAFIFRQSEVGVSLLMYAYNQDNTNGASHAVIAAVSGGSSGGDALTIYEIAGGTQWASGIDNSDSDKYKISGSGALGTNDFLTITTAGVVTTGVGGWIGNDAGADVDFRWESDIESYCLMVEGTLNNIVLCANAEPAFNTMSGGVFLAEANVVPTGNPTAGGYIYVEGGALKYRGTGGTITTLGAS